jgi:antitoxin component YwqK of YwqJK toxin-antitoxin module
MRLQTTLLILLLITGAACTHTKTESWPNGNKKSEIALNGNNYEGIARYWYEDGTIQMVCTYKNNVLDGPLTRFYTSGFPKEKRLYLNGKLNGKSISWDPTRKIQSIFNYTNDILDGHYIEYYPNGLIKVEGQYIKGDYHGMWLYYDEGGGIIGEGRFDKGNGFQKAFTIMVKSNFIPGIKKI